MNKFLFKSSDADLQKIYQSIETIQKNVLYLTYRTDTLLKKVNQLVVNKDLQKQVDDYFEESQPEEDKWVSLVLPQLLTEFTESLSGYQLGLLSRILTADLQNISPLTIALMLRTYCVERKSPSAVDLYQT